NASIAARTSPVVPSPVVIRGIVPSTGAAVHRRNRSNRVARRVATTGGDGAGAARRNAGPRPGTRSRPDTARCSAARAFAGGVAVGERIPAEDPGELHAGAQRDRARGRRARETERGGDLVVAQVEDVAHADHLPLAGVELEDGAFDGVRELL